MFAKSPPFYLAGIMFVERSDSLWNEIESLAGIDGLSVYDIEKTSADKLRIFVHRPKNPSAEEAVQGGVSSDDCSKLLRRLQSFFLAEGSAYGVAPDPMLEVSSPGINRKLRVLEQFKSAVGERVKVVVESGVVIGVLLEASSQEIAISSEEDKQELRLPFLSIKKANVEFKF